MNIYVYILCMYNVHCPQQIEFFSAFVIIVVVCWAQAPSSVNGINWIPFLTPITFTLIKE